MDDIVVRLRRDPRATEQAGELKRLLKTLGRRHGLMCVEIAEVPRGSQWTFSPFPRSETPEVRDESRSGVSQTVSSTKPPKPSRRRRRDPYAR